MISFPSTFRVTIYGGAYGRKFESPDDTLFPHRRRSSIPYQLQLISLLTMARTVLI
jgi:hypothetical protein